MGLKVSRKPRSQCCISDCCYRILYFNPTKMIVLRCFLLWCILVLNHAGWAQNSLPLPRKVIPPQIKDEGLYYGNTIMSAIQSQRLKLEQELSPVDKKLLAEYRAKTSKLEADFRATNHLLPTTDKATDLARHRRKIEQFGATYNPSDSLAEKYEGTIRKLLQELEPQRKKWEADLAAIQKRHQLAGTGNLPPARSNMKLLHRLLRPAMFISMHPPRSKEVVKQAQVQ